MTKQILELTIAQQISEILTSYVAVTYSNIVTQRWKVYQMPYKDCPGTYIRQTNRYLKTQIQEHKNSMKYSNSNRTALAHHALSTKHTFDFERTRILSFETFYKKRINSEMILIKANKNSINHRSDIANLSLI